MCSQVQKNKQKNASPSRHSSPTPYNTTHLGNDVLSLVCENHATRAAMETRRKEWQKSAFQHKRQPQHSSKQVPQQRELYHTDKRASASTDSHSYSPRQVWASVTCTPQEQQQQRLHLSWGGTYPFSIPQASNLFDVHAAVAILEGSKQRQYWNNDRNSETFSN